MGQLLAFAGAVLLLADLALLGVLIAGRACGRPLLTRRWSAALVLMFAFFVLSTSPGTDIKQFGIGLAAGIIFDATVIRALLVPAIMRVMGRWNWWLPPWAARFLRVQPSSA